MFRFVTNRSRKLFLNYCFLDFFENNFRREHTLSSVSVKNEKDFDLFFRQTFSSNVENAYNNINNNNNNKTTTLRSNSA